jgi:hypothetical protein
MKMAGNFTLPMCIMCCSHNYYQGEKDVAFTPDNNHEKHLK